jgi:FAD/FMN-containing dehydrogenase
MVQGQQPQKVGTGLESLRAALRGPLHLPGDEGYDASRALWNAMIDRRPAVIVRAAGAADVRRAVAFARDHGGPLAVKGGGHNIAGNAVCDNGITIDLSPMKSVRIDPEAKTARVEPGVTLGEFDREAQAFGLATPTGINSTTGIAGLTLGGGFGWLSRKHGLTVDNLLSADIVTADGRLVRASERENPDLFWAIRGGGGNFGVVTSFEFRLHPVGPEVFAGLLVHPISRAKEVFEGYRRVAARLPDDVTCWVVLRKAPPLPFLPPAVHGTDVMILAVCHAGDPAKGPDAVAPLRSLGTPVGEHLGPVPFTAWQSAFDPLLTPGARNYWKSHDFREIPDGLVDLMIRSAVTLPSPACEIFLAQLGGAVNRVAPDATAYPHRDVAFAMNVHTRWDDAADDERCIAWARRFFQETAPFATGGVYVNFMPGDEAQRVRAGAYGGNFERLARIKRTVDPKNLFRMNHNIPPAA